MLARTMSSSLFGTTSLRHNHSSSVQGERKSTFSAAVTKRRAERSEDGLLMKDREERRTKSKIRISTRRESGRLNPNLTLNLEPHFQSFAVMEIVPSTRRRTVSCRAHRGG